MFNRGHWKQLEDTPDGPRVMAQDSSGQPTYSVAGADATSFTTDFLADRTVDYLRAHKDNKGVPYEGSAKVPFLVRYPGAIRPGTIVHQALGCVDFMPTILSLMGAPAAGGVHGRDASALLRGESPADWNDLTFVRSTGEVSGWVAAVTDRYKLVYATADEPWLFDLEQDPDELVNRFRDPACCEVVRELSRQLARYGEQYQDPRVAHAGIQSDLAWAIRRTGPYVDQRPPEEPAGKAARQKKRKQRVLDDTE